jgi:hypothetical protein
VSDESRVEEIRGRVDHMAVIMGGPKGHAGKDREFLLGLVDDLRKMVRDLQLESEAFRLGQQDMKRRIAAAAAADGWRAVGRNHKDAEAILAEIVAKVLLGPEDVECS